VTSPGRVAANLATLANAFLGASAIAYVLAGNKLWAMLLIVCGIGFDGLDGLLSRRAGLGPSSFGRVFDSVADAITFGIAPGLLVAVELDRVGIWRRWEAWALWVGVLVAALAIGRLAYFTWRGYRRQSFLGASTPQNALALIVLLLFFDYPGFAGTLPVVVLGGAALLALLMVLPIPYPKLRRGTPLRPVMMVTAIALGVALVPVQFRPPPGSPLALLVELAAAVAAVGMGAFYLVGPWTVRSAPTGAEAGFPHG
jgi:CDP-diacylglycerol--serine O-phosphatidyltransferase